MLEEKKKQIVLFFLWMLSIFLAISLWSYDPLDPHLLSKIQLTKMLHTKNWCGRIGATLGCATYYVFGIIGNVIPLGLLAWGVKWHKAPKLGAYSTGWSQALGASCILVALCVLCSVYSNILGGWFAKYALGGWLGDQLKSVLLLELNTIGVTWFAALSMGYGIMLLNGIPIIQKIFYKAIKYFFSIVLHCKNMLSCLHVIVFKDLKKLKNSYLSSSRVPLKVAVSSRLRKTLVDTTKQKQHNKLTRRLPHIIPTHQKEKTTEYISTPTPQTVEKIEAQKDTQNLTLPSINFLRTQKTAWSHDRRKTTENALLLKKKLQDFGILGEITGIHPGPVITLYEFCPAPGVKVSKVAALADDLSMALAALSVRILAPIPGKAVIGIEIPHEQHLREIVLLSDFLNQPDFKEHHHTIPMVMGKNIAGHPIISDLTKMPHLLVAGQTGSGKSVFMNGVICSLLYRFTPAQLRLLLIDPKLIEFQGYHDIPHLLAPIVDDATKASTALKWAVLEMQRRYQILACSGVRHITSFNQKLESLGSKKMVELLEAQSKHMSGDTESWKLSFQNNTTDTKDFAHPLPYIVIVIDELADLMMVAKKDVEVSIARIAQKARAAGIHLIIATQRPSTDVITGLIKANLPSRASFQLASYIDSKTILDRSGAERLLGQGDMLFIPPGSSQLLRLHAAYLSDQEIESITNFLRSQHKPNYRDDILLSQNATIEDSGLDGRSFIKKNTVMDGIEL